MVSYTQTAYIQYLKKFNYIDMTPAEMKKAAEGFVKKIDRLKKKPKAAYGYLTVKISKSGSARAILEGAYTDGRQFKFTASAGGGGYDREGKAIALVLDKAGISNLLSKRKLPSAIIYRPTSPPSYDGRWSGFEFPHIGAKLGLKIETIRSNSSEKIYKVVWK